MRRRPYVSLLVAAGLIAAAGPAAAVNCYTILDRNDNVVYRGTLPPIDLSDKGAAERETLRQRGQHLIAMDVDRCLGVEYFTGTAGSATLTVDQIVGGIQMRGTSPAGQASAPAGGGSSAAPARSATPASAAPAAAPRAPGMSGSGTRTTY